MNSRLIAATETFKKKKGYSDATIRKMQTGTQKKRGGGRRRRNIDNCLFLFFFVLPAETTATMAAAITATCNTRFILWMTQTQPNSFFCRVK